MISQCLWICTTYYMWNRLIDYLEEPYSDTDKLEEDQLHDLLLLQPDAWAISWGNRQVLLLELNRAHD